uniref:Uncharacterized protein n=1 Tax=Triticum urartu TaxID=4572 RepID=A0A8R7PFX4_TRIUA
MHHESSTLCFLPAFSLLMKPDYMTILSFLMSPELLFRFHYSVHFLFCSALRHTWLRLRVVLPSSVPSTSCP